MMAYGPGIEKGKLLGRRHITDVASTLLYSLGLDVPSDFEGVVPANMFTAAHRESHPIRIGAATQGSHAGSTEAMDDDEKQQIMEQLQMLGYVE